MLQLDAAYNFDMYWTVTGSEVSVQLEADVTGWMAIGFSADGTMTGSGSPGSDIAMAYVTPA